MNVRLKTAIREQPAALFPAVFVLGFLIKYDFLALMIYQVPTTGGLIGKNIVWLTAILLYIRPILRLRRGKIVLVAVYIAISIFFFMNVWYNRYFGDYLSLSDMLMGRGVRPVKVLLWQLSRPADVLFLIDVIALIYLSRKLNGKNSMRPYRTAPYRAAFPKTRLGHVCAAVLLAVMLTIQIVWTNHRAGGDKPIILYQRSTSAFAGVYGIIPLYAFEYYSLFHPAELPLEETAVEPLNIENDLAGKQLIEEDQNIIVIQVESLDQNIIDLRYNGREVTPFLNSLKERALYFDNFYAQHVNGSFDAEFSFFTSMYPINKNFGFKVNDLSAFDSLVGKLNRRGYTTLAFHGNDKTFFYRDKAYEELGFDRFYSREDYEESIMKYPDTEFYLGINDYDFFQQSFNYLVTAEEPYFAFFITVTSHTPFDFYPEEEEIEEFSSIPNPLVRGYFNSMAFTDASLRAFFDRLSQSEISDNTAVIIYADHNAGIEHEIYASDRNFVMNRPQLKVPENVPLFFIYPEVEPGISHKEGSPTDLGPTILDMLGEEEKPADYLGCSLLSDEKVPILFMHEIPQILYEGQIFARFPFGLEYAGYAAETGSDAGIAAHDESTAAEENLPRTEELLQLIDYLKNVMLERREDMP